VCASDSFAVSEGDVSGSSCLTTGAEAHFNHRRRNAALEGPLFHGCTRSRVKPNGEVCNVAVGGGICNRGVRNGDIRDGCARICEFLHSISGRTEGSRD
jgi:hypothetical protein